MKGMDDETKPTYSSRIMPIAMHCCYSEMTGPKSLFNIFVSDMDSGIEYTPGKSADDTKLCGVVNMVEVRDTIQRDLDGLERLTCANLMKFNKAKCKVLHLGGGNPKHKYRLGGEWIDSKTDKKDPGVLVDKKFNMRCQCASWAASKET